PSSQRLRTLARPHDGSDFRFVRLSAAAPAHRFFGLPCRCPGNISLAQLARVLVRSSDDGFVFPRRSASPRRLRPFLVLSPARRSDIAFAARTIDHQPQLLWVFLGPFLYQPRRVDSEWALLQS